MLLHDLSWIPILVQSFISISYLIGLLKRNNNNNNKKEFEVTFLQLLIVRFKAISGVHALFDHTDV